MSHCRSAQDNKALWQKQCHNIDSKTLVSERVDTMDLELLRRTEYNQQYNEQAQILPIIFLWLNCYGSVV